MNAARARDAVLCATDPRARVSDGGSCQLAPGCGRNAGWVVHPGAKRGCTTHAAEWLRRN